MRNIFLVLFFLSGVVFASEEGGACSGMEHSGDLLCKGDTFVKPCDLGSNWGVTGCNYLRIVEAESELSSIYEKVLTQIENNESASKAKNEFMSAQEKWIEFKDSTCLFMDKSSIARGEWNEQYCILQMTKSRMEALKSYLAHLESLKCGSLECHKSAQW
ncbi:MULTISPECIES: lysozyme inhibitor LprI family protein [unclassified Microbulbifer]|uniref:lysozyme inhibitor LprI family protein n=1 Tax=unclassified Microbulbifer TaxID=2619833 RepID=UPI0027E4CBE7|nr:MULTISPECIES: lysozyme inhibitor LprI family protein [unclassified Microbulbifer]